MMTAVDNTKYEELCRLCATKTTMVLAINIFENEGAIRQISKKIETCLPVKVHESDELPKMICENCLYKLELLSDFRERSVRTEKLLLELHKEIASHESRNNHSYMISMIPNEMTILPQHQQNPQNNSNVVWMAPLGQMEGVIVQHEVILAQQHADMSSHSFDSLDMNNHNLMNDHSNQSIHNMQDIPIAEASHSMQEEAARFDNLNLIQQQLFTEQLRLQQELHLGNETENNLTMPNNIEDTASSDVPKFDDNDCSNICDINYNESNNLTVESMNAALSVHNNYLDRMTEPKIDHLKQEDNSNSNNSLNPDDPEFCLSNRNLYNLNVIDASTLGISQDKNWLCCNVCGDSFENKTVFDSHYEKHFFKCDICLSLFTNTEMLNTHRKEAHGSRNEEVKQSIDMDLNTQQIKQEKPVYELKTETEEIEKCKSDETQVAEELVINEETIANKEKKSKVCKECGKSYKSNYKLTEHMRIHTGEKPFKCGSCDKCFLSKMGLAQHEAKHTGQYDYSCPTCGKGFQCKSYLRCHQKSHSNEKPFTCTTCGQNFKTKQSLLDHTNRHLGVKPYMCGICGKGFITKSLCRAHEKVHSGLDNRKYSCYICTKMFVSKSYLRTHMRIHTGEKPFKCEDCGKGFVTRVDLKIHMTLHTGEKSYVCEICGKAFARRDALRCHRRSHTGERPYRCEICGQTFTQFTPMAIHKRLHTGERPYACETCGRTFVSRSTMLSHAKKHTR